MCSRAAHQGPACSVSAPRRIAKLQAQPPRPRRALHTPRALAADSGGAAPVPAPPSAVAPRPIKLQLTQSRAKPTLSLGQHFLQDMSVVDAAIAAAAVSPGDRVLEIGPGTGVLTRALLAAGASVVALEKDERLAHQLVENNPELVRSGALTVVHDDVLRWLRGQGSREDFPEERASPDGSMSGTSGATRRAKVVANIPYGITTELLSLLLPRGAAFSACTLLVQEELAQRLVLGGPGASDAREMSIRVRFYAPRARYVRFVPRAAFAPPPRVDSAVVRFDLDTPASWPLPAAQVAPFFALVRAAFNARRKMLRNTLPGAEAALLALAIKPDARPQELSMTEYVGLFTHLRGTGGAEQGQEDESSRG